MNESIKRKLLEMRAEDARVRAELAKTGELFEGYCPKMEKVHLENAEELEKLIDEHGWLGKSMVGEEASEAAWLIVHHAISMPKFSRKCLDLIERAVQQGEAEAKQAAYLKDRICFFEGSPQRFGTQSDWNADGKMQIWTLEDESKVNEYRAEIGLTPLENLIWENDEPNANRIENWEERQKGFLEWTEKVGWR
jgi:hypothetical protein